MIRFVLLINNFNFMIADAAFMVILTSFEINNLLDNEHQQLKNSFSPSVSTFLLLNSILHKIRRFISLPMKHELFPPTMTASGIEEERVERKNLINFLFKYRELHDFQIIFLSLKTFTKPR
jgi:hypothetical protein